MLRDLFTYLCSSWRECLAVTALLIALILFGKPGGIAWFIDLFRDMPALLMTCLVCYVIGCGGALHGIFSNLRKKDR